MRRLLTDSDLFERLVLLPLCTVGAVVVPLLIWLGVSR